MIEVVSAKEQMLSGRRVAQGDVVKLPSSHARALLAKGAVMRAKPPQNKPKRKAQKVSK